MNVYFANPGAIDPDVIRTLGVNVKENSNPIGYFGTGLKYAIATLLRTGHSIGITTEYIHYEFTTRVKEVRGKEFEFIFMNDEQLGFTTDLGKNWKVEDAYRELHSNCLDEGGQISDRPLNGDTVIRVTGNEFLEAYYNRGKIFLESRPMFTIGGAIEVHAGQTNCVYYRGVRVYTMPKKMRYTYNILTPMRLTEDRTLAHAYEAIWKLESNLPRVADKEFANSLLDCSEGVYVEGGLDWSSCPEPSEEFLDAVQERVGDLTLSKAARELLHKMRDVQDAEAVILTQIEERDLETACQMITEKLNSRLTPKDVTVVEHLGPNIYACVKNRKIYVTRRCIANGVDFLAITLYEEWIHKYLGYPDESRSMQQHLFDKILELIKK